MNQGITEENAPPPAPGSRGIVVLGMHRSGTSVVAGTLGHCGAWIGQPAELTGSSIENKKGFFERRDLRNICNSLLFSVSADWWRVADFQISAIPEETARNEGSAFANVISDLSRHGTWVIKEPRLCLLFPMLRKYLSEPICILPLRNPIEIAKSLRARNNFSITQGIALWELYARSSLLASDGLPRVFVRYDHLVKDPVGATGEIIKKLQSFGVGELSLPESLKHFVTSELYRETAGEDELNLLDAQQLALWNSMLSNQNLNVEANKPLSTRTKLLLSDLEIQYEVSASRDARLRDLKNCASDERLTFKTQVADLEAREKHSRAVFAARAISLASQISAARASATDFILSCEEVEIQLDQMQERNKELESEVRKLAAKLNNARSELKNLSERKGWRMPASMRSLEKRFRDLYPRRKLEKGKRGISSVIGERQGVVIEEPQLTTEDVLKNDPRIIVYTCLFGNYENLKEPANPDPRVRWIAFTDDPNLTSSIFEVVLVTEARSSVRRTSRMPKILSHRFLPDHDISLYIDASLQIVGSDVVQFVLESLSQGDYAAFRHHARRNVFEEIEVCRSLRIERAENCDYFEQLYREEGRQDDFPLFENMLLVRRNTILVKLCNEIWWGLYERGSQRDQLSLSLALIRSGVKPREIRLGKQVRFNEFVRWEKHKRDRLPALRPRVFIFVAYAPSAYNQNLGRAYNDYMARLSIGDWGVFIDHDAMLMGRNAVNLLIDIAAGYSSREVLIVGCANRINNPYQRVTRFENEHSLSRQEAVANSLFALNHDRLYNVTDLPSSSGFFMMLSKKTWETHAFEDGFLGVDNAMHKSFRDGRGVVLFSPSLYAYHFYRADGDVAHAIRMPVEVSTKVSDSEVLQVSETEHFMRTFVVSEETDLTVKDYFSILKPGEWAVFLSRDALFAQKSWNSRLAKVLRAMSRNGLLTVTELDVEEANLADHLAARQLGKHFEDKYGDSLLDLDFSLDIRACICAPFELVRRVVNDGRGHVSVHELAIVAQAFGAKMKIARGIVLHVDKHKPSHVSGLLSDSKVDPEIVRVLSSRQRVAMITLGFWPQQAGMELVFHNLATGMTVAGDEIVLFAPQPKSEFKEIERNYIIRRFKDEEDFRRLFDQHHRALPFDVILVQGAFEATSMALSVAAVRNIPVVLRTHGEDIQIDHEIGYGYRLDPRKAAVIQNNLRLVDCNLAISNIVRDEIESICPDRPISVVGNGVDIDRFRVRRSNFLRERFPQIGGDTCILLMVGRNVKKKSFALALEALSVLVQRGRNVCLVHVGKPGSGENLREKASAIGVDGSFFEVGELSYFDLPAVYASADVFVFPSKLETFGNVTLEAMACGLPCVEFDYGANHDKIQDGVTGRIVKWGDVLAFSDALDDLILDLEKRQEMGRASRVLVEERFAWPIVIDRYRTLLKKVVFDRRALGPGPIDQEDVA